jgi:hypothetical protein
MDKGQIVAQAYAGDGGNILIRSDHFYASYNSLVSASSKLGVDGEVTIESPDTNSEDRLLVLPTSTMGDVSRLLKVPCENRSFEDYMNRSRFLIFPIAGSTPSPFDLQPSHLSSQFLQKLRTHSSLLSINQNELKSQRLQQIAWLCRHKMPSIQKKTVISEQLF